MAGDRWFLNGWFEAGCHTATAFSTYHNIEDGRCAWCGRSEADLVAAGARWVDAWGNARAASSRPQERE